jgi:uncharacterized protein DUF3604
VIGFGLGASKVNTQVTLYQYSKGNSEPLMTLTTHAESGEMPGVGITGPAGAAAGEAVAAAMRQPGPSDPRLQGRNAFAHLSYSPDAGLVGDHLDPDKAFRLARGEQLRSSTRQPVRLERPYDWMVITDHAESLGLPQAFASSTSEILKTESGKRWADALKQGGEAGYKAFVELAAEFAAAKPSIPHEVMLNLIRGAWMNEIAGAQRN